MADGEIASVPVPVPVRSAPVFSEEEHRQPFKVESSGVPKSEVKMALNMIKMLKERQ